MCIAVCRVLPVQALDTCAAQMRDTHFVANDAAAGSAGGAGAARRRPLSNDTLVRSPTSQAAPVCALEDMLDDVVRKQDFF